ncbi:DUF4349 domain-containing protein [Neobacillus terrae]|uniref:DUF4349 domain-containing protein n=1 Tax=Neobacillus terrae TaxID=3034837 RepID=UPI003083E180
MKRLFSIFILVFLMLSGCSSNQEDSKVSTEKMDKAGSSSKSSLQNSAPPKEQQQEEKKEMPNRMVIYHAELELRVKNFEKTVTWLEQRATAFGGYVIDSNVSKEGKEQINGTLTIRVPQKHFQEFLNDAEGKSEVLNRQVTGQDVSEEYVDLESRLRSKKAVEARLLEFMKNAAKTEDLLKISSDLSSVQEEIEKLEGKINFLRNQTDYSTVTITLNESKVIVPHLDKKLNTWERIKKQFVLSANGLLTVLSGLAVFLIGNIPVFTVLFILVASMFLFYKKIKKKNN